jgi:response regulator RpfG family c-di-GMP phosphodiesterase
VAEAVRVLVAGLPAEIVREIGLRIRGAAVTEFENTQQMGRAASQGEAELVILSDTLPTADSIYVARRARDGSDAVRISYLISMAQAEAALHALKEVSVDRFFFSPVDIEEMVRELAKMCKAEVLPSQGSHARSRISFRVTRSLRSTVPHAHRPPIPGRRRLTGEKIGGRWRGMDFRRRSALSKPTNPEQ